MTTRLGVSRRRSASVLALTTLAAVTLMLGSSAQAANSPAVPLGTSRNFSVLGASAVTNTGPSTLRLNLGVSPGTSITGFPPGLVIPPANTNRTNAVAAQAQVDLTNAYINAKGRALSATTTADLANKHLTAGVYAGPSKSALLLSGPLVLDGAGDASSVFIFQTDSSLTTASGSTVTLINGAQECNVFWQIGSSAILGTGSTFAGNIMALASISLNSAVTVHGRALARSGAVTLIDDTFTTPTCAVTPPTTTPVSTTPRTTPGEVTTPGGGTIPGGASAAGSGGRTATPGVGRGGGSGTPGVGGPPRTDAMPIHTGSSPWSTLLIVGLLAVAGSTSISRARRKTHRAPAIATETPVQPRRP